jgi:hypothetical protein
VLAGQVSSSSSSPQIRLTRAEQTRRGLRQHLLAPHQRIEHAQHLRVEVRPGALQQPARAPREVVSARGDAVGRLIP